MSDHCPICGPNFCGKCVHGHGEKAYLKTKIITINPELEKEIDRLIDDQASHGAVSMQEKRFLRSPSQIVSDMEQELLTVRKLLEGIKASRELDNVDPVIKAKLEELFKITSAKYSFEQKE